MFILNSTGSYANKSGTQEWHNVEISVEYLEWIAEGNIPAPYSDPVPSSVTMSQARLALLGAGRLSAVNAAIAAMSGTEGEAAQIQWQFAQDVERNNLLVDSVLTSLGLDSDDIDQLFIAAAAL